MLDLDQAPEDFLAFEKDLKKRAITWVTSRDDGQRMRALSAGWLQECRPIIVEALGETEEVSQVDEDVQWLRSRCGVRTRSNELREKLRGISRTISRQLLPAYETIRWSQASSVQIRTDDGPIQRRLSTLDEAIAKSYEQALLDLSDPQRLTYVGPATELREVLRATLHRLSPPDEEISAQPWFKGHQGKPTQAERVRAILDNKERSEQPTKTLDIIDQKIGLIARLTYQQASAATHLGRDAGQDEVNRLRTWVDAVLGEILPNTL
ncbi:hypothetical protein [Candidatus Poriferisocius sp.]|uniref:pPIWI-associating nuclease domain-containing protein n=1 Tax=Candidatus Poriferisocius sp. TaxID=3101276 RepID=UPI003B01BE40